MAERLEWNVSGMDCASCVAKVARAVERMPGVGVKTGETGALVRGGLFRLSRNPTFLGQGLLLIGVALAVPSIPAVLGAGLFFWSARTQIRSEEAALLAANGVEYQRFLESVPRWIGWPREGGR